MMRMKLPEMEREQIFNASQKELFLDRSKDALDYLSRQVWPKQMNGLQQWIESISRG